MNTFSIGEIAQMSYQPELAYGFPLSVQEVIFSPYQSRALAAVLCNLVGVGITEIQGARKVGSVLSVNVTPFQKRDPTLLICPNMNLSAYYEIWSSAVGNRNYWNGWDYSSFVFSREKFSEAIRLAVRSARNLEKDEIVFAVIEMLHFQNEMMCR
jgi:hypothetical protein